MPFFRLIESHKLHPAVAWLGVLLSVFTIEYLIMLALPLLLSPDMGGFLVSVIDAVVLTVTVAPILWWFIVRPLNALIEIRTRHLLDVFNSIEEERRRVAMELHDSVGQSLTMLVSGLKTASAGSDLADVQRRCGELQQISQDSLRDVKRITLGLRPSLLDDLGLAPAVSRLVEDINHHHKIDVAVNVEGLQGRRLPAAIETAAFRIVQEALNNAVKHSHAATGSAELLLDKGCLVIRVEDDGRGLAPVVLERWNRDPGHLGLTGMCERAALLGGSLSIESRPSDGMRIVATIPIGAIRVESDQGAAR